MDNQEAIRLIRNLPTMCEFTDAYGEPIDSDAYYEAVDIAISALHAQELSEIQKATDTVSRQAAIDALGEEPEVWTGKDEYAQGLNNQWHYDVNALKALPSAQPEIVRCSDCKECWYSGTATIGEKVCEIYKCKFWDRIVSQNGYCYMAERRADGLGDS